MVVKGHQRGGFGTRLGFVLAAAGSAIGLGNIWRFPYTAGENGGAAFILVYLVCVTVLCVPVLFAELAIGRASQRSPVSAFKALAPRSTWFAVGGLGVLTGFAILAFYSVVAGWVLGYLGKALAGHFATSLNSLQSAAVFDGLVADVPVSLGLTGVFLLLTALVVRGGIQGGIERCSKILMPIFFFLLIALAIRSVTLPGAEAGLAFIFKPDLSKLSIEVCASALGQAFFSLSLGMGAMITYGSYVSPADRLPGAAVSVAFFDTMIAILAGMIIFPALFAKGGADMVTDGTGLVFKVLPTIFGDLPAGQLFAVAFYVLLGIAALTSTVSLLEVVVAYFVDERRWGREKATWVVTAACFLLAIPSAVSWSLPISEDGFFFRVLGTRSFLGAQSVIFGKYALSIGALLIALFVGWKWGVGQALAEISRAGGPMPLGKLWGVLIRYICPLAILAVIVAVILGVSM